MYIFLPFFQEYLRYTYLGFKKTILEPISLELIAKCFFNVEIAGGFWGTTTN